MNDSSSTANRLRIFLDPPSHKGPSFVPSDLVKGEIVLHNPEQAAGIEASVSFSGISSLRFKEKGRLFFPAHTHEDHLVSLCQGDLTPTKKHDRLIWPFSFTIPSNVQPCVSRSPSQFLDDDKFAKYPGYTLPPTVSTSPKGELVRSADKESADRHITVVYHVEATLTKPHFSHPYPGPTKCQRDLPLSPYPFHDTRLPAFHVYSYLHRISPYNLTTDVLGHGNVYSHSLFWKTMKPYLHLHLSMPGNVFSSQALDVKLSFDHSFVHFAAVQLPPVVLRSFGVSVILETCARVSSGHRRHPQSNWEEKVLSCSLNETHIPVSNRSCILAESLSHKWDIHSLVPELRTSTLKIPTFKTWNIAMSYTLHVQGEVSLDNEKIRFDVKKPLIVLPDYSVEEVLPSSGASPYENTHVEGEASAPPPYSKHQDSAVAPLTMAEEAGPPSYNATLNGI
ncbi:MAG: hypothetical protein LQ343_000797 [Gyalolechia ehrenbergii]|nr:MAG: hypothetical protein LQ343_000797 [Gyalolechia ehrenbergii]